jgi:hypothetical protein
MDRRGLSKKKEADEPKNNKEDLAETGDEKADGNSGDTSGEENGDDQ